MAFRTFEHFGMYLMTKFQGLFYCPGKKFMPPENHPGDYQEDEDAKQDFHRLCHYLIPLSFCRLHMGNRHYN